MSTNVLVIGANAGAIVARTLANSLPESHRLILIDRLDFAFHPISSLRGSVQPGFEENNFADLDNFFGPKSRHVVLKGTEVVRLGEDSVTINGQFEGSDTIPFAYACLALGSTYPTPGRPSSRTKAEAMERERKMQRDIKAAKKILIIGGGPVGVELAGEIRTVYPASTGKEITLATNSSSLIPGPWKPSLGQKLGSLLSSQGVTVKYDTKVDLPEDVQLATLLPEPRSFNLPKGGTVEADFVVLATGGKPNTTLVSKDYPSAIDGNNLIKVDPATLRVLEPALGKYFAFGDATDAPGSKTFFAASQQAPIVAAHLQSLVEGKGKAGKAYKSPMRVMVVPFGPGDGQSQLGPFVLGGWITSTAKGKSLFTHEFKKLYLP